MNKTTAVVYAETVRNKTELEDAIEVMYDLFDKGEFNSNNCIKLKFRPSFLHDEIVEGCVLDGKTPTNNKMTGLNHLFKFLRKYDENNIGKISSNEGIMTNVSPMSIDIQREEMHADLFFRIIASEVKRYVMDAMVESAYQKGYRPSRYSINNMVNMLRDLQVKDRNILAFIGQGVYQDLRNNNCLFRNSITAPATRADNGVVYVSSSKYIQNIFISTTFYLVLNEDKKLSVLPSLELDTYLEDVNRSHMLMTL